MAGKPKFKVKHDRRKENLNLYIWLHPRNQEERLQNKNTLALAEKIRFEREQAFLEDRAGYNRQIFSPISRRNVNRRGSLTMSVSRLSRLTTVSSVFSRKHRDTASMTHSCTWKPLPRNLSWNSLNSSGQTARERAQTKCRICRSPFLVGTQSGLSHGRVGCQIGKRSGKRTSFHLEYWRRERLSVVPGYGSQTPWKTRLQTKSTDPKTHPKNLINSGYPHYLR